MKLIGKSLTIFFILIFHLPTNSLSSQNLVENPDLDKKVKAFLDKNKGQWHDMNVPVSDGKLLYDIIIKNKYKHAF